MLTVLVYATNARGGAVGAGVGTLAAVRVAVGIFVGVRVAVLVACTVGLDVGLAVQVDSTTSVGVVDGITARMVAGAGVPTCTVG